MSNEMRELLERILPALDLAASSFKSVKPIRNELRALLAKPAKLAKSERPHCLGDSMFGCAECEPEDLGQHQGEPVAWDIYWTDNGDYYFTLRHERRLHKYASDPEFKVVPLYIRPSEQPAPVAVVLPERMNLRSSDGSETYETKAWNACLDEVARLNPRAKP